MFFLSWLFSNALKINRKRSLSMSSCFVNAAKLIETTTVLCTWAVFHPNYVLQSFSIELFLSRYTIQLVGICLVISAEYVWLNRPNIQDLTQISMFFFFSLYCGALDLLIQTSREMFCTKLCINCSCCWLRTFVRLPALI